MSIKIVGVIHGHSFFAVDLFKFLVETSTNLTKWKMVQRFFNLPTSTI